MMQCPVHWPELRATDLVEVHTVALREVILSDVGRLQACAQLIIFIQTATSVDTVQRSWLICILGTFSYKIRAQSSLRSCHRALPEIQLLWRLCWQLA